MEAVYAWVKGAKFVEVQKLTGQFEGSTIRSLRRLEELVRQVCPNHDTYSFHIPFLQTHFMTSLF
jgi:superfamily II RNA helicase